MGGSEQVAEAALFTHMSPLCYSIAPRFATPPAPRHSEWTLKRMLLNDVKLHLWSTRLLWRTHTFSKNSTFLENPHVLQSILIL